MNDLVSLRIERPRAALRLAERRHRRPFAQQIDAGVDALGLLDRDAVVVARADEILDDRRAVGIDADRFQRLASKAERGLERLAHFELDVPGEQLQRVAALLRTRAHLRA